MITTPLNAKMFGNLADALHHYDITPVNREAWNEINHWHPDLNLYQEYYKLHHGVSIDSLLDCYKFELGNILDRNFVVIQGGLGYYCCMVLELPMPTKTPECYQNLIKAFTEGDIYNNIASVIYNCDPKDVTKEQRRLAKNLVFNLRYYRGTI